MKREQLVIDNFTNLNINFNYDDERLTYTRHRTTLTNEHLKDLELKFSEDSRPSNQVRADLAKKLSLTERTVQIWFQNRRTKARAQGELPPANKNKRKSKIIKSAVRNDFVTNVDLQRCNEMSSISPVMSGSFETNNLNYNCGFPASSLVNPVSQMTDCSNYIYNYNPFLMNNPYQLQNFNYSSPHEPTLSPPSLLENQLVMTNEYTNLAMSVPVQSYLLNQCMNFNQTANYFPNFNNENSCTQSYPNEFIQQFYNSN